MRHDKTPQELLSPYMKPKSHKWHPFVEIIESCYDLTDEQRDYYTKLVLKKRSRPCSHCQEKEIEVIATASVKVNAETETLKFSMNNWVFTVCPQRYCADVNGYPICFLESLESKEI